MVIELINEIKMERKLGEYVVLDIKVKIGEVWEGNCVWT